MRCICLGIQEHFGRRLPWCSQRIVILRSWSRACRRSKDYITTEDASKMAEFSLYEWDSVTIRIVWRGGICTCVGRRVGRSLREVDCLMGTGMTSADSGEASGEMIISTAINDDFEQPGGTLHIVMMMKEWKEIRIKEPKPKHHIYEIYRNVSIYSHNVNRCRSDKRWRWGNCGEDFCASGGIPWMDQKIGSVSCRHEISFPNLTIACLSNGALDSLCSP